MTRADQGSKQVSQSQKRLLQKLHINLGHPPRERFLRMLRAAGAHEHVIISYVKNELQCEVCDVRRQPDNRRRAQYPKTFSFNRLVCVDAVPEVSRSSSSRAQHGVRRNPLPGGPAPASALQIFRRNSYGRDRVARICFLMVEVPRPSVLPA